MAASLAAAARRTGLEHGATIDSLSGTRFGAPTILVGEARSIDLGPHLIALDTAREYVSLHAHAGSGGPSVDDVLILYEFPPVRTVVIACLNLSWHVIWREPSTTLDSDHSLVAVAFQEGLVQWIPHFRQQALEGALTPDRANRLVQRAAWSYAATLLSLRYAASDVGKEDETA